MEIDEVKKDSLLVSISRCYKLLKEATDLRDKENLHQAIATYRHMLSCPNKHSAQGAGKEMCKETY